MTISQPHGGPDDITGLLTTGLADGALAGGGSSAPPQHVVLSASATAARLLGTTQAALLGADLRQVLVDAADRRSLDGWSALEGKLQAELEASTQLPAPPTLTGDGAGSACSLSASTARWLDVSVTALHGGRYAWSCNPCAAPQPEGSASTTSQPQQHQQPQQPQQPQHQQHQQLSPGEAAALRALPLPVWVCASPGGRLVFANAAFYRLVGCTEGSAAGRPWTQLLQRPQHPADAAAVQRLEAAIAAGQGAQEEVQCRGLAHAGECGSGTRGSVDGCVSSSWWGAVSVSPLEQAYGSSGSPLLVCTLQGSAAQPPVSAASAAASAGGRGAPAGAGRHGVAPALAQLCNQALASTTEGVVITDPTQPGNPIVWANAAFERMTGYIQASVLGRGHSLLQGPDTDPVVLADIAAAMEEGRPVVAEVLTYRRDGSSFWCQVSITPIRDASMGRVANFVTIMRDVSQHKAGEAASHMREQALSNLNEGICICDATVKDCPVVYCNSAFLRITGYSRREVLGRNCRFLQGSRTDPATVQRLATALHEGREVTVELLNYRKSGEEFYNMLSITPVRDASGRLLSFIGVQSDITELVRRRQAEKELQEAKVAAETAVEAKSMFLANMSHEIRTPLNGMIAVAQLLLSSGLAPEQRELADTILESGNTLLTILGDILDFSKIDHNSMELESAPVAMRDVVESSVEMVAADAGRKGLDVAYSLAAPLVASRLMGDGIRIRQILANLLSNAVKFTSAGEVLVEAWVEPSPSAEQQALEQAQAASGGSCAAAATNGQLAPAGHGSRRLHVTVKDTGIGIPPASMQRLFQQFRQGHESMSRRYGGTGLGLAISRRLAQLMGGEVWAESLEGQGSTFHFTMALAWEGELVPAVSACGTTVPLSPAAAGEAAAAGGRRDGSGSFESEGSGGSLSASRRRSSDEQQQRAGASSNGSAAASAPAAACDSVESNGASSGQGAEEQRQQLQQHHEALLQRLAQRSVARDAPKAPASSSSAGGGKLTASRLSGLTDAPGTPCMPQHGMPVLSNFSSAASGSSLLTSLAGSVRSQPAHALAPLQPLLHQQTARHSQSSSDVYRLSEASRGSIVTAPPAAALPPLAPAPAPGLGFQRGSGDSVHSVHSCPEGRSMDQGQQAKRELPLVDYRKSAFYFPTQPIQKGKLPPKPVATSRGSGSSPPSPLPPPPAAATAEGLPRSASPGSASAAAAAVSGLEVVVAGVPEGVPRRSSSGDCGGSCQSAPANPPSHQQAAAAAAAAGPGRPTSPNGMSDWSGLSGSGSEASAVLRGRQVCIDIAHSPTAEQVAQSCRLLGMEATLGSCQQAAASPGGGDFCITTADKSLEAVRSGWRGRPLVVLGRRDELPVNLQALATTVSKPVKHARLVGALLKANAFTRSKQQAPLHCDPQMLSLLPERLLLNPLATNRRISLDNSALDRRRWEAAAAAAAAAAADSDSTLSPLRTNAPAPRGPFNHTSPVPPAAAARVLPAGAASSALGAGSSVQPRDLPSFQTMQLEAERRGSCEGGWRPELPVIPSDGSHDSSQRSSLDGLPQQHQQGGNAGGASGAMPASWHQALLPQLQTVAEDEEALTSPPATVAPRVAPASALATATLAAAAAMASATRPPRILVAEDNLINQRVIRKVLQRVAPAAEVEVVGNGLEALAAVHRSSFDLVLMDIHMPEMDGLEASKRLQAELPPDRRPIVVALSADTLQELHQQCREAGIREFICKPFRVEDVERVLRLVQPRLHCVDGNGSGGGS